MAVFDGVVLHIPHASTIIPHVERRSLLLDDAELDVELLRMTDWFTDQIFHWGAFYERVCFPVSRLIVDPERFPEDAEEPMAARGMGVVYERTSDGRRLRRPPSSDERRRLLERYYRPHYQALSCAVLRAIHRAGHCFIIDCHSFPARPLPYEKDDRPIRDVELCIGTDPQNTPEKAVSIVREALGKEQVRCWENDPFAGTLVPAVYRGDRRVSSIMLEVNRSWYMCEETGEKMKPASAAFRG